MVEFADMFQALTGKPPFPWQQDMFRLMTAERDEDGWAKLATCSLPTGLGKTNAIAVWLIALAARPDRVPRRLVYVVNRRTVVDQTTTVAQDLRWPFAEPHLPWHPDLHELRVKLRKLCDDDVPLAISTLRGQFADNREWSADPSRPAIICGTVDMIGSRLLFSGYGLGFKSRPLHAGFLGQDVLLVHDEAHLEPAFQDLLVAIQKEQERCKEFGTFHVVELSATSRGGGAPFGLTDAEKQLPTEEYEPPTKPVHTVWRRLGGRKGVKLHGVKRDVVAKTIGETARGRKDSGQAILVFVRTIEDVKTVRDVLTDKKQGVPAAQVEVLTGTLRGKERDALATENKVFARFQPEPKVEGQPATVFLICTSAGEVGVDISADHMVSDLTPLDSMAQRLGRVNRRGGGQAEVDVVYETDPDPKKADDGFELARWATKTHLERLPACEWAAERHEASPREVGKLIRELSVEQRKAAFAPEPTILPTTDILHDAWALTTVRDKLPGRPPVAPYLHGVTDRDPPETHVAWRQEVEELRLEFEDGVTDAEKKKQRKAFEKLAAEVLEDYPLKPHETLREPSYRAFKHFVSLAERDKKLPVWLVDDDGAVQVLTLGELGDKNKKDRIDGMTVLLPPAAGGLNGGQLDGTSPTADDVADWSPAGGEPTRKRVTDGTPVERGWRLVRSINLTETEDGKPLKVWQWLVKRSATDEAGAFGQSQSYPLDRHNADARQIAAALCDRLKLDPDLTAAVTAAAGAHDLGKNRDVWQRSIGNAPPKPRLAKSGHRRPPEQVTHYRHEFGSLLDVKKADGFDGLSKDMQELCLHLIAAHHGRGRPHFPPDEAFDPERPHADAVAMAAGVPGRFARLQRTYGRWGLAYLESLVRASDVLASKQAEEVAK